MQVDNLLTIKQPHGTFLDRVVNIEAVIPKSRFGVQGFGSPNSVACKVKNGQRFFLCKDCE